MQTVLALAIFQGLHSWYARNGNKIGRDFNTAREIGYLNAVGESVQIFSIRKKTSLVNTASRDMHRIKRVLKNSVGTNAMLLVQ